VYRDSRWQKKRLEIMERDNWTCKSCGATGEGVTLNVHHAYYESGKMPWEYEEGMLVTWCDKCHKARHEDTNCLLHCLAVTKAGTFATFIKLADTFPHISHLVRQAVEAGATKDEMTIALSAALSALAALKGGKG
jgi:hypothetical protein